MRGETVFEKRARRPIEDWLAQLGLERYADSFVAAEIDFDVLADLGDSDLAELGLKLGDRKRVLQASAAARAERAETNARPATVVYCDLVDTTDLAVRLEPRELRAVMSAYHVRCADVVAAHGGKAQYLGGGVMVRFAGVEPGRNEADDARRAIRCALALLVAIGKLPTREPAHLRARVGIATGSEDGSSTPSFAARLQRFAEPESVLIADATRRLLGEAFRLTPLGDYDVTGRGERSVLWRVEREETGTEPQPSALALPQPQARAPALTAPANSFVEQLADAGEPGAALRHWQNELERAERSADPKLQLEALHALWTLAFALGDLSYTLAVTKRGVARFDSAPWGLGREVGAGHDVGVCAAGYRALALILSGRMGEGRSWMRRAHTATARCDDPSARCAGVLDAAVARDLLGEFDVAIALASDVRKLAGNRLPAATARAALISAAARIAMGDRVAGIRALRSALDEPASALPGGWRADYLVRLSQAEIVAGDPDAAEARLAAARDLASAQSGCIVAAEIERVAAALLRLHGASARSVTERLEAAARLSRSQGALLFELRSASDSLEFALGSVSDAVVAASVRIRALLARIEDGDATFDVRRARTLEQLAIPRS